MWLCRSMNVVVLLVVWISSGGRVRGHHPFFPRSAAPSPSPSPNAQVEAQFHSLSQSQPLPQSQSYPNPINQQPNFQLYPFFPTSPSPPPPPSPSALVTFPANISALLLPHVRSSFSSSSTRKRLFISLTISLSLIFSAILVAFSAFLIYSRNRSPQATQTRDSKLVNKTSSRVRLFPPNTLSSDSPPPKILHRPGVPSSTSSEFLYLGTLATPNTPYFHPNFSTLATNVSPAAPSRATGSPDLRPLPPLPKLSCGTSSRSGEALIRATEQLHFAEQPRLNEKDEDEDFFSPRESPRVLVGQKLADLLEVKDLAQGEPMLIRISADAATRRDVLDIAAIFRAKTVDVSDHSITLQLSGSFDKMVALQRLLEPYGDCEVLRTGKTA